MKILIHTDRPDMHIGPLRAAHPDLVFEGVDRHSGLKAALETFRPDVLYSEHFTSDAPFPREDVLAAESLAWVQVGGSGTDHIAPWDAARLTVTNAAGIAADMIAEYVLGTFLHFNLDVPGLMADQAARRWDAARTVRSLDGATLLIVGLGKTGQALATRASAFGMHVLGTRARPRPTPGCAEVHGPDDLPNLWPRADYIAVATPRLPSTLGLVDADAFEAMKPGVVLANVARGDVVDEAALIRALQTGHVRAAAVDVFAEEPLPADNPIWDAPNLLISPHCSAVHAAWEERSIAFFSDNLERRKAGDALANIVDPDRGY